MTEGKNYGEVYVREVRQEVQEHTGKRRTHGQDGLGQPPVRRCVETGCRRARQRLPCRGAVQPEGYDTSPSPRTGVVDMDASAILKRLSDLGVLATVAGDRLHLRPGSRVPAELVQDLRAHKEQIMVLLRGYHLKYLDAQATGSEIEEIAEKVRTEGYVLLWSSAVHDLVAFYRDGWSRSRIPPGFVPYAEQELRELFADGGEDVSGHTLRLVHEAKRHGGVVVGHECGNTPGGDPDTAEDGHQDIPGE